MFFHLECGFCDCKGLIALLKEITSDNDAVVVLLEDITLDNDAVLQEQEGKA